MVAPTPSIEIEWIALEREVRERLRRRLCSPRHWHDVDEMTQRVLEAVWRRAADCRDARGLAFTIARRRAVDVIRSRTVARREADVNSVSLAATEPSPFEALAAREERSRLIACAARLPDALATLPEAERSTVCLHYQEGLSFNQIDARFGWRRGSASAAHRRAKLSLRELLSPIGRRAACVAGGAYAMLVLAVVAGPLFLSPAIASAAEAARQHSERSPFGTAQRCPLR